MQRSDFIYNIPERLIARYPSEVRGASRLLCLDGVTGVLEDKHFTALPEQLRRGDLLVLNDTRVIPARLLGYKQTGGRVEFLAERVLGEHRVSGHLRASKVCRVGTRLIFEGELAAEVVSRRDGLYELVFSDARPVLELLGCHGRIPLPPYLDREAEELDRARYQTIYACRPGAVAAPTAGLHFDHAMLTCLQGMGVELAYVTLHVGSGTFQPVQVEDIKHHRMHAEQLTVDKTACAQVYAARMRGGRVVAVGTTVVRALESAALAGALAPHLGETRLFIYPGHHFRIVDAMITNFHSPASTLLMLVCAFAGCENVMRAYRHAIEQQYRFFSYGDAMFVTRGVSG